MLGLLRLLAATKFFEKPGKLFRPQGVRFVLDPKAYKASFISVPMDDFCSENDNRVGQTVGYGIL